MDKLFKFLCATMSIVMIAFYGIYVTNIIFNYLPFNHFLTDIIDNIVFFVPMTICALLSITTISSIFRPLRWIFLILWILIFVCSFVPGSILGLFA